MSEELFSQDMKARLFSIDHALTEETEDAYFSRKATDINDGKVTWMVRSFEADGRTYGLWYRHLEVAVVDDEGDGNVRVYVRDRADADTMFDDVPTLHEGIERAEQYWGVRT